MGGQSALPEKTRLGKELSFKEPTLVRVSFRSELVAVVRNPLKGMCQRIPVNEVVCSHIVFSKSAVLRKLGTNPQKMTSPL